MNTTLIVTIDTEEEGLWGGRYPATGATVENIRGVRRFQALCDRFDVRPTYLVDAPVVQDDAAVELLRPIQDDGRAEIGAHLHPWCNPPLDGETGVRASYLCNLPESLQRHKLVWLTDAIEERFGRRPTSFRAGRYGLDAAGARILAQLGYLVDSSVLPFTDYSFEGGPNFENAPHTPYFIDGDDLCRPHASGFLLEVPASVGYNRVNFERAHRIRRFALRPALGRLRGVGILDRLGIVRRIKFSPEQADPRRMKQLAAAFLARKAAAMVMMFHSTSLAPGFSPYVKTEEDLDRFHQNLEATFEYCLNRRGMKTDTLSGFALSSRPACSDERQPK